MYSQEILRYVKGTLNTYLKNEKTPSMLISAFSDAYLAGSTITCDFAIFVGSNLISWCARKQPTVLRSSTEAEFKALADAVTETMWVQKLLSEMQIRHPLVACLLRDNLGAKYLATNHVFRARTKHIEIYFHFMCGRVAQRLLDIRFINSGDQVTYGFTKPLTAWQLELFRCNLNLVSVL